MMQVRIRYDFELNPTPLCEAPLNMLDDVIPTIKRWGLYTGADRDEARTESLSGQIVYDGDEAYFEVVINTDDL